MLSFILGFIVTLISLLIGFVLGKLTNPFTQETVQKVKQVFDAIPNSVLKKDIGAVERPTATMVEDYNNPVKRAGDNEMSKTLEKLVK